ncbi:hypothetical protein [Longitalea luteola]|uniref:hypothetical protein n=1 Tax=Longitalea luteola TaxID=2812563 RepID=UPI001A958216|nr:hypothetical protein [Longitalea luteola]
MRRIYLFNKMAFSGSIIFALLITGCSKNERAIEETRYTTLELKAITVDPLLLQFTVDETQLNDLLATPNASTTFPVKYLHPTHRFRVMDQYSNTLMADTMIDYKAGEKNTITFFQPVAGGKLVLVGPPVNEPLPPAEKKKISIVYSLPAVPDKVKVVVDNSLSGTSGSDYIPSDSFSLKRGEFSPYFWSWNNRKPKLRIYDTNDNLILEVNNSQFAEAIADFSIFSFSGISAGSVSLTKLY